MLLNSKYFRLHRDRKGHYHWFQGATYQKEIGSTRQFLSYSHSVQYLVSFCRHNSIPLSITVINFSKAELFGEETWFPIFLLKKNSLQRARISLQELALSQCSFIRNFYPN